MLIIGNPLQRPINHRALEPALEEMLELGINGLEVCTPHIELCVTPDLRRHFGDYVRKLGFKFCRYNSLLPDYLIEMQSPDQVPGAIAGMKRDVDICVDLGINQLMTWEGKIPAGKRQDAIDGWILEETIKIFREGVSYAESKGVSVSLEVHPFSLGMNVDWLVKLCDGVGSDSFGVTYDCAHFAVGLPDGYVDAIYKLGKHIKHLHFSDSDLEASEVHYPLGEGKMDLPAVIKAIEDVKFSGTLMLDVWLWPFPIDALKTCMAYVKEHMSHLAHDC
jgi:sugar phosphate isomerase/epimerase